MGFDKNKFLTAGFVPRESEIDVPDLAEYFQEGTRAVWKVRGLNGQEMGRVNAAVDRHKNTAALAQRILAGSDKDKIDAMLKGLGFDSATPADIVRRMELLQIGSVDPVVDRDLASRICEFFVVVFFQLTTEILSLTGKGHVPGKRKASGETTASTPA